MLINLVQTAKHKRHSASVRDAAYSPTGNLLATGSYDNLVMVWDTASWDRVQVLKHANDVHTLRWHPTDNQLLVGCDDGVYLWNTASGELITKRDLMCVYALAWSADAYVCGTNRGCLYAMSLDGQQLGQFTFTEGYKYVYGIVAVDSTHFIVVASNRTLVKYRIYSIVLDHGAFYIEWQADGDGYRSRLSPLHNGQFIAVCSCESTSLDVWDISTHQLNAQLRPVNDWCRSAFIGDKAGTFLVGCCKGDVVVWNRDTNRIAKRITAHAGSIRGIAIHPIKPCEFISYSNDKSFIVWNYSINDTPTRARIDPDTLEPDQCIGDQYSISNRLGEGGMAILYAATDLDTDDKVALKFYKEHAAFEREVKFLNLFHDPAIIRIIDAYPVNVDHEWYPHAMCVLPIGKRSLHNQFNHTRPLKLAHLKVMVEMMVETLQVLQEMNVVHCDLKPSNWVAFKEQDGFIQWKLIDFDAACRVGDPVDHATLEFCAPEVLRALQVHAWCPAAFSMDLFSLGRIIMWLASTDNDLWPDLPEDCSDAVKEAFLLSDTEFSLYGIHDDATRDIINRLLQKSPQDRLTLKQLQDTTYVKMDMYTRKLYLKPNRECCRLS